MDLNDFLTLIKTSIPAAIAVAVAVICLIILIRFTLEVMLFFAKKKYQKLKKIHKDFKKKITNKLNPKEDSELFRRKAGLSADFSIEKNNQKNSENLKNLETIEIIKSLEAEDELEETKIVDLVKPVGKWTSMILGQKLTYLISSAQLMNKNSHKGFWTSMVEAQEKAQGRQKGRGL